MTLGADMSETQVEKPEHMNPEMPILSLSKRKQPLNQKAEEKQLSESGGNKGRSSKSSPRGKENTRPSREAKAPSQKRGQSWVVSPCGPHKRSSKLEEKRRARPSPHRERGKAKPGSTHRRDSSHTKLHIKDRRTQPSSPVRTLKCSRSGDSQGASYNSAKRRRQLSPLEASSLPTSAPLMSRVFTNMDALQVALDNLQAPGGAFLCGPSSSTEPTASQRAWLTWQLSHAGAALHWALHTVNYILTVQASLPRYTWPQGYSFTADPRPAPNSSSHKIQASLLAQRPGDLASPKPFCECKKYPGLSTAGLESSEHQTIYHFGGTQPQNLASLLKAATQGLTVKKTWEDSLWNLDCWNLSLMGTLLPAL
ncbi:LOW QUALITY PROTEIN: uncharacterized protein LOC127697596 [Apodemus sylvaticus]|uniref:LOW QUALITY PROTEIN: uncharacterized protein LOC127697596 n=1 Tax=Apodemus sylvaticus TaxID=10129 RepID=UPI002241D6AA|nr:LOW QUALITY PROTEIN: uncharacterized protein LOC127697596 [Apodemus sylvaticus]